MMKKLFILLLLLVISFSSYSQNPAKFKDGIELKPINAPSTPNFGTVYFDTAQNIFFGWDGTDWLNLGVKNTSQLINDGEDGINPFTTELSSKNYSWGESYITNWRDLVLDDGATYFPNNGGYEKGRLHQLGLIPSLHFIPAAVGEGIIYAIGKNRTNDLDVSNSASTYVDEDGIIQTAAIDFARIDYTDGDGAILVEDQSTNLLIWSEAIEDTGWDRISSTITVDDTIAPDGVFTADKIVETIGGIAAYSGVTPLNINLTSGDIITGSAFFKAGERKYAALLIGETSSYNGIYVDLTNGNITKTEGTIQDSKVTPIGNQWYRVSVTFEVTTTDVHYIRYINSIDGINRMYTGDGTSGIYIWGSQLEQQSVESSYIKTEGTTVTRLADVITGAGDVNTFNSKEGVLFVEMAVLADDGTFRDITISDGTVDTTIRLEYTNTTNQIRAIIKVATTVVANLSYTVSDVKDYHKAAIRWKINDFSLWIDGIERATENSGAVPSSGTLDKLNFAEGNNTSSIFYGKVKDIKVLPYLTDEEMILLTKMFGFMFLCRIRRKETEYKIAA